MDDRKTKNRTCVDDVVAIVRAALADPIKRAKLMEQARMYKHINVLRATPGNEIYNEHRMRITRQKVKQLEAELAAAKSEMDEIANG